MDVGGGGEYGRAYGSEAGEVVVGETLGLEKFDDGEGPGDGLGGGGGGDAERSEVLEVLTAGSSKPEEEGFVRLRSDRRRLRIVDCVFG